MPRLSPAPRPPAPPNGYPPSPIAPNWDRQYILDDNGQPVRVFDFGTLARWESWEGKGYQIKDELPEHGATVWTYFSAWASMHDDKPPMFRTTLRAGAINRTFESVTWEEAEDKHRRVIDKVLRTLPRQDLAAPVSAK